MVLDQYADEALERAHDRAVQHHRGLSRVVLVDVFGAQPARHHEIDLDRTALPRPPDTVLQVVLDLRPIEGTLAGELLPFHAALAQSGAQAVFGLVPDFVRPEA